MNLDPKLLKTAAPARGLALATLACQTGAGVTLVAGAALLSRIVTAAFLEGAGLEQLGPPLAAFAALGTLRAGLTWAGEWTAHRIAVFVKDSLREEMAARWFALGPAFARDERTGELTVAFNDGIESLDAYFSQYLPQLALTALLPLALLAFIFPRDLLSGAILLITAPLLPVFMQWIGEMAEARTHRQWTSLRRMGAHFLDTLQGLTTLKQLGRSHDALAGIADVSDAFRKATMDTLKIAFLSALVLELVATLSTAVVAVEIGLRLLYGKMEFEPAFFILILAPEFYRQFRLLGLRFHAGISGTTAAKRIFAILETKGENINGIWGASLQDAPQMPNYPPLSLGGKGGQGGIKLPDMPHPPNANKIYFNNVSYTYPDAPRPALESLSLTLEAGRHLALVGPSGAGKSTVAQLLLRFLEPTTGEILIDDTPMQSLSPAEWRRQVAWMPQQPHLFHGSLADNLRLGAPQATEAEIEAAARRADLHNFIAELPDGYATLIGERGLRLSGGEAQRLALARAFLKNAPLLILDEPTSHIDPDQERQIQEALAQLMTGRTVLTIAHRLVTAARADWIWVLDEGRLIESGPHADLLARGGWYARWAREN